MPVPAVPPHNPPLPTHTQAEGEPPLSEPEGKHIDGPACTKHVPGPERTKRLRRMRLKVEEAQTDGDVG
jgi:hypothetical protein